MEQNDAGEGSKTTEHAFALTVGYFGPAGAQIASELLRNDQDPNVILLQPAEQGFVSFKNPFENEDVLRALVQSIKSEELRGQAIGLTIRSENELLFRLLRDSIVTEIDQPSEVHQPKFILYQYKIGAGHEEASDLFSDLKNGAQISHIFLGPLKAEKEPIRFSIDDEKETAAFNDSIGKEVAEWRKAGVQVILQLQPTQTCIDAFSNSMDRFEEIYEELVKLIRHLNVDGIDLSFTKGMISMPIYHLGRRLKRDLGTNFSLSLSVEARALQGDKDLRFHVEVLERMDGNPVSWYNVRFFNGGSDFLDLEQYEMILDRGWPSRKIVPVIDTHKVSLEAMEFIIEIESARRRSVFGGIGCWYNSNDFIASNSAPLSLRKSVDWLTSTSRILDKYTDHEQLLDYVQEERQKQAHFHKRPSKFLHRMETPGAMDLNFRRMDPEKFTEDMRIETLEIKASKEVSTSAEYSIPSDSHFMAHFIIPKLGPRIRFIGSPVFDKYTKNILSDIEKRKKAESEGKHEGSQQGPSDLGKEYMIWKLGGGDDTQ